LAATSRFRLAIVLALAVSLILIPNAYADLSTTGSVPSTGAGTTSTTVGTTASSTITDTTSAVTSTTATATDTTAVAAPIDTSAIRGAA
jgi:hypothetical protein